MNKTSVLDMFLLVIRNSLSINRCLYHLDVLGAMGTTNPLELVEQISPNCSASQGGHLSLLYTGGSSDIVR